MFRTPLALFRVLAFAEAVSWTLLITGLVLRATVGLDIAVSIGGGIHGFVFLSYAATAIVVAKNNRWSPWPTTVAVGAAIVPYATIPVEIWLHRTGRLAGQWRPTETDDPRDLTWHDRIFRTLLRHPWLFALALAVGVVVVFTVLLIIGPPGGRD
ncbi:DUF3817 domain-containing protein [Microbacterium sp. Sa4CUA7]|uniref:DUF3817 domain-containing protein n=1 Tax=Microbacterium pullorum TaxID=2762236 RepID=A0ABR8S0B5_9MICO|nr:DUF3817 domain-containing protein [Microbacterium pullorum]MBD7956504.1 DUF3817 domain-containing protein [Microbacterium pullorum]